MPDSSPEAKPESTPSLSVAEKYPCPTCGGLLNFDPKSGKLKCPYCGAEEEIPDAMAETVEEHSFEGFLMRAKSQTWGMQLTSIKCETCGATTQVNDRISAMNCPFCDHPLVIDNAQLETDAIKPESVLPFQVDPQKMTDALRAWIRRRWFAPSDLKKYWEKGKVQAIYLPYWTFDARTHTSWTAEAGHYYYVKENNQEVRKVRWEFATGERDDFFDDELLCASKGFSAALLSQIEPFNTQALKPYRSEYLAGYLSERYALGPREAWQGAQQRIYSKLQSFCARDVPGDTQRNLQISPTFSDIKIKHTLLPVYIGHYFYQGKNYPFFANGQTGKIGGKTPLSWVKILMVVLGLILLLVLYGYFNNS